MNMNNIAAVVNTNITTCRVGFVVPTLTGAEEIPAVFDKLYTYKIQKSFVKSLKPRLASGEKPLVIVQANNTLSFACIVEIDDETDLDTHFKDTYKWVVCSVSMDAVKQAQKEEKRIAQVLKSKQRQQYRKQFLQELGFEDEQDLRMSLEYPAKTTASSSKIYEDPEFWDEAKASTSSSQPHSFDESSRAPDYND